MGLVERSDKPNGTKEWVDGDTMGQTPLNGDINPLVNEFNGNIENTNVKSDAAIATSKLDDASATDAASRTHASPTNSATPSKPTTLEGEIQRLRNRIMALSVGTATLRNDGTASADEASWQDQPRVGPNLFYNPSFEAYNGAANSAPDGWSLVGTPTTVAQVETDVDMGEGKAIRIVHTGGGSDEGISMTFAGLKASTRYVIGGLVEVTSGTFHLKTTGATGSDYGNLDLTSTASDFTPVVGIVITDATPTNVVVQLISEGGAADDFRVDHMFMYELSDNPVDLPKLVVVRDSGTTEDTARITTSAWNTVRADATNDMTVAVTVPGPGYVLTVTTLVDMFGAASVSAFAAGIRIVEGSTAVAWGVVEGFGNNSHHQCMARWVNETPTPGTTYTYTVEGRAQSGSGTWTTNETGDLPTDGFAESWLELRLEHVG